MKMPVPGQLFPASAQVANEDKDLQSSFTYPRISSFENVCLGVGVRAPWA